MKTENHNANDEKLVSQVRDALDDSVNRIDAETNQRIVAARKQALASTESGWMSKIFTPPKIFAATATALSIFVAVFLVNTQLDQAKQIDAIEIAGTQDAIDLYEEIEFYTWLVEEDVTS